MKSSIENRQKNKCLESQLIGTTQRDKHQEDLDQTNQMHHHQDYLKQQQEEIQEKDLRHPVPVDAPQENEKRERRQSHRNGQPSILVTP